MKKKISFAFLIFFGINIIFSTLNSSSASTSLESNILSPSTMSTFVGSQFSNWCATVGGATMGAAFFNPGLALGFGILFVATCVSG